MQLHRYDYTFLNRLQAHLGERVVEFSDDLCDRLYALWQDGCALGAGEMCVQCGSREGVGLEDARTLYVASEENPDPNAPVSLCRGCATEHHEHWDSMWIDYNEGRL